MLSALLLLVSSEALPLAAPSVMVEPDPKAMSQREIRAHNATVPENHPFHIRCVREAEIGSLVKRSYSCRTNRQWREAEAIGNQDARDTYEEMTSKSWRTSG